jgi:hypothetical protein
MTSMGEARALFWKLVEAQKARKKGE